MHLLISLTALTIVVLTSPTTANDCLLNPTLKGPPTTIGILEDPTLNRDSCGSVVVGHRALWVCRDTNPINSALPVICNSASWTDLNPNVSGTSLNMYGFNNTNWKSFYPLVPGNCNQNEAGACSDGTRYPHWPNSPPLIPLDELTIGYTFVPNSHIKRDFTSLIPNPSTVLYRVIFHYDPEDPMALPQTEIVDPAFWTEGEIPYGTYGGLVSNSFAYLYSQDSSSNVAIARVPVNQIEDKTSYEFYVGGEWTSAKPGLNDHTTVLEKISGQGQGTFYYSEHWQLYVWIGQTSPSIWADFYISTAPQPEGPWCQLQKFYSAPNGNGTFPAYSLQAHPGLVNKVVNEMYLTYTKNDKYDDGERSTTPLIRVEFV